MRFRIHPLTKKSAAALFIFTLAGGAIAANTDVIREIPISGGRSIKITREALLNRPAQPSMARGQFLVVDTRDEAACERVRRSISGNPSLVAAPGADLERLCDRDPERPMASVLMLGRAEREEFRRELDVSSLTSTERTMATETRNVAYGMVGMMGVLYLMPESVTNWNPEELGRDSAFTKYRRNVGSGPVMDKDDFAINYVGHPVSGAAYYMLARHAGMSRWGSFGYSVMMSTFFWEYGVEAFAEKPSIQDLIITPVVGSLMGELFFNLERQIEENGGTVLGSRRLGRFTMVLLNPLGSLSNRINRLLGSRVIQSGRVELVTRKPPRDVGTPLERENDLRYDYVGIHVRLAF